MKAVLQRVRSASVSIAGEEISSINQGLLALLGVARDDEERDLAWMADKIPGLRIFSDDQGKMNRSLTDAGGAVLLIAQLTLMADIRKGQRPSFASAAKPEKANAYYEKIAARLLEQGIYVALGKFGAHLQVQLVNDGPVTILLDSRQASV